MPEREVFTDADGHVGWAVFSPTRRYRYELGRRWGFGPSMVWLMLNPSTADERVLDPTIRRCVGFAKREGYRSITVLNLYALRATDPKELLTADDPEGPANQETWRRVLTDVWNREALVVAAWGAYFSQHAHRLPVSLAFANGAAGYHGWRCLGVTKRDDPRHPLYVKGDTELVPWEHGMWEAAR